MIAMWDKRFSVGNALADAEHRQVISVLNEVAVAQSVGAPDIVVEKALESLVRAVANHFRRHDVLDDSHLAIAAHAQRLLDRWREGRPDAVDRRALAGLARRWIAHMGRGEATPTPHRLAG